LFLLLAAQPAAFKQKSQPAWVSEWTSSRARRAQQKADKAAKQSEEIVDPAAQSRRAEQREKKSLPDSMHWNCGCATSSAVD
jgi:hypothetical protein